ncbi:protein encore isoform X2 [Condylostylus longicornis]|uniref:protein encore isoform X2 n=1 Tax=Condylostylus longicornis TaxID=2530218 RepID=UPI00244E35D4|nr:protein encore isoform X2 [Condylostylus longicornis]
MSSAPTQIAVAPSSAGNLVTSSSGQIQKDYLEEPLARQNSLGNRGRGGLKGKALTRSHAMREAASPPRTPTPRSDQLSGLSPITSGSNHPPSSPEINDSNTSKMHVQSVSSVTQTTMETPSVIITTQQQQSQQQQQQQQIQQNQNHSNVVIYSSNDNNANSGNVICNDVDFPKLTPPKSSKGARNRDNANNNSNNSHNNSNNVNNNGSGAGGIANNGSGSGGGNNICNNIGMDNNNKTNNNEHKIHQQQQQLQQSISSGDSTNYINGKKVVNDSSNIKSPNNHNNNNSNNINNNNINNSNGQNNNNSSINSINNNNNNNNNDNSNIQINSSSTNTSNRNNNNNNSNLNNNNDSYINNNNNNNIINNNNSNNNNNNNSINVSVSQLNPQASPYINNSPISPPVTALSYDKDNRCPRNESQNSNNSGNYSQEDSQNCVESPNEKSDRLSKKHRNGANSKGTKPRLKNMSGSSSSMEGGNNSSTEQFTDQSGIDLVQFFKETLNKSPKDRTTLMEIEKDLIELAHDKSQKELRFQPMSSYKRMLIHRVAAFFGMEHNVDKATQQCVIVAPTKATRIPDIRFKQLVRDEPRKSILKRDTHSFDESRQGSYLGVDRGVLDRKAKSFEEREEEYQKARRRIFRGRESIEMAEEQYWGWSNSDNGSNGGGNCGPSPSNSGGGNSGGGSGNNGGGNGGNNNNNNSNESSRIRQNNKLLKPMERQDSRQNVSKSHNNFGGYGGGGPSSNAPSQQQQQQQNMQPLSRNDSLNSNKSSGQRAFSKQDSAGSSNAQSWRLSPSSSGYKTQTQSLRSDSITPSPTGGYGSSDDHTSSELLIEQTTAAPASCGVVWAVTDMASVPRGSVLINPHTLQPFVNQDGSVYHFDPSNLPPNQSVAPGMYNNNPNNTHRKNKMERQKKSSSTEQHNNNCSNNANTPSPGLSHSVNSTTPTPIDPVNGTNLMNSNSNSTSTDTNTTSTTSIDNISEMSGQTVVNINPNNNNSGNIIQNNIDIDDNDDDLDDSSTKENQIMINREMDDIEEEIVTNYEECEKSTLKVDDELRNLQEKPKFINQATSPNIPSPEPEYNLTTTVIIPSNEVGKPNIKSSTSDNQTPISISNVSTRSTPSTTLTDNKKEETKTISSNIPIMSYATGYQTLDGATVFQPAGTGPYTTTTYQQGPDGSVYAVPQQMVYTYPQPIDGSEIQGYFVYDQGAAARDGTTLVPTPVYQPSSGTTVVPVAAYPSAPFGSAPIYQQQVVYTPEQFPNTVAAPAATAAGQVQQYPVTYPVGYSYPYNGYWGQAMTYYVPQPPLANAVSSSIIPPPPLPIVAAGTASTAQTVNIGSSINPPNNSNSSHSGTVSGKRNTPPQQTQQHSHHHHHNHSNQQQQQQQQHHHHHHHQQQQSHHQSHHTQTPSQQQQQQQSQQHQQHQQNLSGQSSQSATPANATYQFATTTSAGVPVALTTDPNGPTMYAIPQSAVFPNAMLPYGHPPQAQLVPTTQATQATPAGVITHLPHQSQTVISPMIAQPAGAGPPGSILPPQHLSIDQTGTISIQQQPHTNAITHSISTNGNNAVTGNHGNRSCTPQSTPSTPVSTTLPTINHHHHPPHRNNPPLFATPPMIPNGFNSQIANNPYQQPHYTETHQHHHSSQQQHQFNQQQSHSGATNSVSSSSYEKKNSYSNVKKNSGSNNNHNNNNHNNNGGVGGYNSNNSGNRQNAYSNNINNSNQRKMHENTNSSVNNFSNNNSSSTNNSNNNRQIYNTGQSNNNKRINNIDKTQSSTTIGNAGANNTVGVQNISSTNLNSSATAASITSNNNNSAQLNSDIKPRPGGIRQKPGNLDFKRNGSQRNSPSTNSAESNNNSPNSIASSHNNNHNNNLNPNAGGGIPTTPVIMTAVTATAAPAEHHQPHPQTHQHQPQQQHQQTMYMTRGAHIPPMHTPTAAAIAAATAAVVSDAAAAAAATHQPLIGAYNHHQVAPGGMYFKYGQTYFAHPSVATLPNNRRSPPNEIRPSLTPIYSTVNMMLPAPRQIQPRHPNPNYKGNKPSR